MIEWLSKMIAHPFYFWKLKSNNKKHDFKVIFIIPLYFTSSKCCNSLLPKLIILKEAKLQK